MSLNKKSCLVGYSGFVGSNLKNQIQFDILINSKNAVEFRNQNLNYLVFSGARAEKWKANQNPNSDSAHIDELINMASTVKADRAVLISTVDVYSETSEKNESDLATAKNHAYGENRLRLETFFSAHFKNSHIIRLPALFGPGLKKNIIYDFLNKNEIQKIDSRGRFQFYDLKNIAADINKVINLNIKVINIATEPIAVTELSQLFMGSPSKNEISPNFSLYNFKSEYSSYWGRHDGYLYSKDQILRALKEYILSYKNGGPR